MRPLNLQDFLLLVIAAAVSKKKMEVIYEAYELQAPKPAKPGIKYSEADIDEIYKAYPTHDPAMNNRDLGKSLADKKKIKRLLRTYTKEDILAAIDSELWQNKNNGKWLKNFSTFLNNLPDIRVEEPKKSIYEK